MAQLGFYIDMQLCSGCRCCQIACKDVNGLEVGTMFREVKDFEGGKFPNVWALSLSMSCNHCREPKCITVCPVAAISKDPKTGLVTQDQKMCIVCERCVSSCPYHAPAYDTKQMLVGKCDGCIKFLELGEQPACVAACSTRSLQFGELEELREKFGPEGLTANIPVLPDPEQTHPSLLIKPKAEIFRISAGDE